MDAEARLQWAYFRHLDCEEEEAIRGLCVKRGFCWRYLFKFPCKGEERERERLKLQKRGQNWWNHKQNGSSGRPKGRWGEQGKPYYRINLTSIRETLIYIDGLKYVRYPYNYILLPLFYAGGPHRWVTLNKVTQLLWTQSSVLSPVSIALFCSPYKRSILYFLMWSMSWELTFLLISSHWGTTVSQRAFVPGCSFPAFPGR